MNDRHADPTSLEVRRYIPATPKQVFAAWTNPSELKKWWGPKDVDCVDAEIDLQVGGQYRIANELPDKTILWIDGVFEQIEAPDLLVYTWRVASNLTATEMVTVRFVSKDQGCEVIVKHERIASAELRDQHAQGWYGCLDGLVEYLS